MKSILKANRQGPFGVKITLKDYYEAMPKREHLAPRKEFLEKVAKECQVSFSTARNWFVYGMKPNKQEHVDKLQEITGILPEDMWEN